MCWLDYLYILGTGGLALVLLLFVPPPISAGPDPEHERCHVSYGCYAAVRTCQGRSERRVRGAQHPSQIDIWHEWIG